MASQRLSLAGAGNGREKTEKECPGVNPPEYLHGVERVSASLITEAVPLRTVRLGAQVEMCWIKTAGLMCCSSLRACIFANIEDTTIEEFERVLSINLKGPFYVLKEVLPVIRKQHYGNVLGSGPVLLEQIFRNRSHMSHVLLPGKRKSVR
jgi:NAD(P)-dependent dehydrogenase (short-subunit alcohol dehydrogenase family)